jgi:hypothetical protein
MYRRIERISLQGVNVRLEPLEMEHAQALSAATQSSWQESVLLPIVADSARYAAETPMLLRDEF